MTDTCPSHERRSSVTTHSDAGNSRLIQRTALPGLLVTARILEEWESKQDGSLGQSKRGAHLRDAAPVLSYFMGTSSTSSVLPTRSTADQRSPSFSW